MEPQQKEVDDAMIRRMEALQVTVWEAQLAQLERDMGYKCQAPSKQHCHKAVATPLVRRRWEILGFIVGTLLGSLQYWFLAQYFPEATLHLWSSLFGPQIEHYEESETELISRTTELFEASTFKAFETQLELRAAVDEYLTRGGCGTSALIHTVCRVYGWPIGRWNVGAITDFSYLFSTKRNPEANDFATESLDQWDLSQAVNMESMFDGARHFQPSSLNSWKVSTVTNMAGIFQEAYQFNGTISDWDTSNVVTMDRMFAHATLFQGNISGWDTSNVESMSLMFSQTQSFSHDLSQWKTSKVTHMQRMFLGATAFNGNISTWDVSKVTKMGSMFRLASHFNQPLEDWDVSSLHEATNMFRQAASFNQDLSNWKVINLIRAESMFEESGFDRNICQWGDSLPIKCAVSGMFQNTPCRDGNDPDMMASYRGPFCHPCRPDALE